MVVPLLQGRVDGLELRLDLFEMETYQHQAGEVRHLTLRSHMY